MAFSSTRMLMAAAGVVSIPPSATASDFNGTQGLTATNTYTAGGSYTGILSFWINFASFTGSVTLLNVAGGAVSFTYNSTTHILQMALNDVSSSNACNIHASMTLSTGTWYNILSSWNTNFSFGSRVFTLYLNNSNASPTDAGNGSAFLINYNGSTGIYHFGAGNASGGGAVTGCVSKYILHRINS